MTDLGPIRQLPIACSLSADAGAEQLARWREFDADYALSRETAPGIVTVHYAKNEDSIERLSLARVDGEPMLLVRELAD